MFSWMNSLKSTKINATTKVFHKFILRHICWFIQFSNPRKCTHPRACLFSFYFYACSILSNVKLPPLPMTRLCTQQKKKRWSCTQFWTSSRKSSTFLESSSVVSVACWLQFSFWHSSSPASKSTVLCSFRDRSCGWANLRVKRTRTTKCGTTWSVNSKTTKHLCESTTCSATTILASKILVNATSRWVQFECSTFVRVSGRRLEREQVFEWHHSLRTYARTLRKEAAQIQEEVQEIVEKSEIKPFLFICRRLGNYNNNNNEEQHQQLYPWMETTHTQPLMTAMGRNLMAFWLIPASWQVSTTWNWSDFQTRVDLRREHSCKTPVPESNTN